jgi:CO/xanthine dehydrogenase Mo-binding subunit
MGVEQQIEGGVIMGIGGICEECLVDSDRFADQRQHSRLQDALHEGRTRTISTSWSVSKAYGTYGAHGIGNPDRGAACDALECIYNAVVQR